MELGKEYSVTTTTTYKWVECKGTHGLGNWKDGKWVPQGCVGTYTDDYGSYQSCPHCNGNGKLLISVRSKKH